MSEVVCDSKNCPAVNMLCMRLENAEKEIKDLKDTTKDINIIIYKLELIEKGFQDISDETKEELKLIKEEIKKITDKPKEKWDMLNNTIISTIAGGVVAYFVTQILK